MLSSRHGRCLHLLHPLAEPRAIDATLQAGYDPGPSVHVSGDYPLLDGGADSDDLYTFACFDLAVLALHWRSR
jgi:hypothetical protein